jgi:hypothetical protein
MRCFAPSKKTMATDVMTNTFVSDRFVVIINILITI